MRLTSLGDALITVGNQGACGAFTTQGDIMRHLCEVLCTAGILAGCGVDAAPEQRSTASVIQTQAPPALGPGAYALPLVVGWPTGTVVKSFDVNSNALAIAGGATGGNPSGGYWNMPIALEVGQSIAAVGLTVRDTAGAPVLAYVTVRDSQSGAVTQWCQGASAGTGLVHQFTFACPGVMPAGAQAALSITPQGQTATIFGAWLQRYAVITIPIAINGPRTGASPGFQGDAFYMRGPLQSAVFQISGIPVGSVIESARVRLRDSAVGPTRMNVEIYPSVDGTQGPLIATTLSSNGTGIPQTIPLDGIDTTVAPLTVYSVYVNTTEGSAQVAVLGIDVSYRSATIN